MKRGRGSCQASWEQEPAIMYSALSTPPLPRARATWKTSKRGRNAKKWTKSENGWRTTEREYKPEGRLDEEKTHSYTATWFCFSQQQRAELMLYLARDKDPVEDLRSHVNCSLEQNWINVSSWTIARRKCSVRETRDCKLGKKKKRKLHEVWLVEM